MRDWFNATHESDLLCEKLAQDNRVKAARNKKWWLTASITALIVLLKKLLADKHSPAKKKKIRIKKRKHHCVFEEILINEEALSATSESATFLKHYELYKHPQHLLCEEHALLDDEAHKYRPRYQPPL